MSTPDVPHRLELTLELPGSPDQVWDAIATGHGISAWFMRTDVEEREGGSIRLYMGDTDSPGTITGWDPPRRFAYVEPEWSALAGHEGEPVTPLATEFLVEAQSGGTCVLRVVSSAFGTGADWEREFFEEMEKGWLPFFDRLRLYLAHFPGQRATTLEASRQLARPSAEVISAMRDDLGVAEVGQVLTANGFSGLVERIGEQDVLVRLTEPVPGFIGFAAFENGDGSTIAMVQGQAFSDGAAEFAAREEPQLQSWLDRLLTPASGNRP